MNARATISKADSSPAVKFTPAPGLLLQRKCSCGGTPGLSGECEEYRKKRETGMLQSFATRPTTLNSQPSEVPPLVHEVLRSPGQPLDSASRAFMEPRFGHDFSRVRVHTNEEAAESARTVNALAYTVGRDVVFGAGQYLPTTKEGQQLMAHELTHVVQQAKTAPGTIARVDRQDSTAEREAEANSQSFADGATGRLVGVTSAAGLQREAGTPHDRLVVERARRRLPILRQFVDEWSARQARRLLTAGERDPILERRQRLDATAADLGRPGQRARIERQNLANLNQRPLNIEITEDEVRFQVSFHIRFEDAAMQNRFNELRASLQTGINLVWNQRLSGMVFGRRRFSITPRVSQVSGTAARDPNYWLITVRPSDNSSVTFPGCTLEQPPAGVTAAVTDSNCAGGVMNLPPAAITDPSVIGHELLHLFGLVDRYILLTEVLPGGGSRPVETPTRETGGRLDPLGGESGGILAEDLTFLFDRLGVYGLEDSRGLNVLRRLEQQGLSINAVIAEISHLEEIIRLGYDPLSLIPRPRRDFVDRIIRQAEDL